MLNAPYKLVFNLALIPTFNLLKESSKAFYFYCRWMLFAITLHGQDEVVDLGRCRQLGLSNI